jgi:hypothetical protein
MGQRSRAALLRSNPLDLRLLVDRENDGMGGWIDIEPDLRGNALGESAVLNFKIIGRNGYFPGLDGSN